MILASLLSACDAEYSVAAPGHCTIADLSAAGSTRVLVGPDGGAAVAANQARTEHRAGHGLLVHIDRRKDPFVVFDVGADAKDIPYLRVEGGLGFAKQPVDFYFRGDGCPMFQEACRVSTQTDHRGVAAVVMAEHLRWRGRIERLRLDFGLDAPEVVVVRHLEFVTRDQIFSAGFYGVATRRELGEQRGFYELDTGERLTCYIPGSGASITDQAIVPAPDGFSAASSARATFRTHPAPKKLRFARPIGRSTRAGEKPPNVILLTVDTLRADHLGYAGYPRDTSPFLDSLARESLVFEDAVAQCGTTVQSFAALLTGFYPYADGLLAQNGPFLVLRPDRPTIAEQLSRLGYDTHAVASQIQTSAATRMDRGFHTFDGVNPNQGRSGHQHWDAKEVTDRALEWIAGRSDDDPPFLLWVHYVDPHYPYEPPEAYARHFGTPSAARGPAQYYYHDPEHSTQPLTPAELDQIILSYDREIRSMDDEIRRLFDRGLERFLDDSVLVFTADHGESLGEHSIVAHNELYDSILAVPLFVRLPEGKPAGRFDDPVMLVDIVPTLLDYSNLPQTPGARGQSLLARAGLQPDRVRLAEYHDRRAVYRGPWKLIDREHRRELYNRAADPTERVRVDNPQQRDGLLDVLSEFETGPRVAARPPASAGHIEITAEVREELRALGYIAD